MIIVSELICTVLYLVCHHYYSGCYLFLLECVLSRDVQAGQVTQAGQALTAALDLQASQEQLGSLASLVRQVHEALDDVPLLH